MRYLYLSVLITLLCACSNNAVQQKQINFDSTNQACLGGTNLPETLASRFEKVEDDTLLNEALGLPNEGKLCQGQVYQSKANTNIIIYRAWNSTNPQSQFGQWWAFQKPAGRVSQYRSEYEICYQWSPLDKLVRCSLKPDTKVVIGTGQSAQCSNYLTYPVSRQQQIYLENATQNVVNCRLYDAEFSWQ